MPTGDAGGLVGAAAVAPDLNFIPSALVKRIDVLTGGASSVYGADAVSGVVNFILDKDFEGAKVGVLGSGFEHNNTNKEAERINAARGFTAPSGQAWDGSGFDAYAAFGGRFGDGRGHATVYLDYRRASALLKDRRDYTNCSVGSLGPTGPRCSGSSTSPTGRFLVFDPQGNQTGDFTLDVSGAGNTLRDFTSNDLFNFAVYNYMQRPDDRYAGGGFLDYDWNEHAQGYAEVMLMDDRTDAQIAPSGGSVKPLPVKMLSADQVQKLCTDAGYGPNDIANVVIGRRNVEGGPRVDKLSHESFRLVGGLKGEINKVWRYDVYGLDAQTRVPETYINDLNSQRLQEALIVDGDPNDPSTWHCRSGNAGCAPWDIFKKGGVTPAALEYIQLPLVSTSDVRTQLWSARANADFKGYGLVLPAASEGIRVALGAEYRKELLDFSPDLAYREGLAAGQGGPRSPVSGSYSVKEGFGEVLVPIVQDRRGAKDLSLELGYRSSHYDTSGAAHTWKVQGAWAPSSDFKIRAGVNRATRAPNVFELFRPQAVQLNTSATQDPCAGPNPTYTQAQCAHTGVSTAQYGHILPNPAGQYNVLDGGNPLLTPEIADTVTYGVVITPKALPGFTAALDYYNIKLDDTIGSLGADSIIKACLETGNSTLCSLVHRDALGTLWLTPQGYTITIDENIGRARAVGVDANLTYLVPAGKSVFTFNLIGTYLSKSLTDTGIFSYDCVGFFGNQCGQPSPRWRHLFRAGWEIGKTALTLGWRMVGPVTVDAASHDKPLADPGSIPRYKVNGSYYYGAKNYFDLAVTYKLSKPNAQLVLGVNNIADKDPPLGSGFSPNDFGPGFYGTYDPYGRYIHAAAQFTF